MATQAKTRKRPAQSKPGLRESKKQRTRQELVSLALRLFQAQGFDNTSVEQIAHEATVSPGTVYNYFPTKRDLLSEVFEEIFSDIMRNAPPVDITPDDTANAVLERWVRYSYRKLENIDRTLLNQLYFIVLSDGGAYERQANEHHSWTEAYYLSVVNALIANNIIRKDSDPALLATALFNIGYAEFRRYTYGRRHDTKQAADLTLKQFDLLLSGVLTHR